MAAAPSRGRVPLSGRGVRSGARPTGGCHARDIGEPDRAVIRRTIAERCLYGVDLNPMAVQLARLSVWLTTLAGDRPLSFLDHRLHVGNSLPARGSQRSQGHPPNAVGDPESLEDGAPSLFDESSVRDTLREVLPLRFSMESVPNDTLEQVREKERAFAAINGRGTALRRWQRVADLWCASWLAGDRVPPQAFGALSDTILAGDGALSPPLAGKYLRAAEEIAKTHRFFHWELECPEVFFAADGTRLANGGFDAVLGNPPWDMMRADHDAGGREEPGRVLRFTRDAGIYVAQSDGHANCYQLFLERAVSLARVGGRVGLVVPAGLVMDAGSASARRFLMALRRRRSSASKTMRRVSDSSQHPVRVDDSAAGRPTTSIACRSARDPAELQAVGEPAAMLPWAQLRLPLVERLSGDDLTIPWLWIELPCDRRAPAALFRRGDERGGRQIWPRAQRDRGSTSVPRRGDRSPHAFTHSRSGVARCRRQADRTLRGGYSGGPLDDA